MWWPSLQIKILRESVTGATANVKQQVTRLKRYTWRTSREGEWIKLLAALRTWNLSVGTAILPETDIKQCCPSMPMKSSVADPGRPLSISVNCLNQYHMIIIYSLLPAWMLQMVINFLIFFSISVNVCSKPADKFLVSQKAFE